MYQSCWCISSNRQNNAFAILCQSFYSFQNTPNLNLVGKYSPPPPSPSTIHPHPSIHQHSHTNTSHVSQHTDQSQMEVWSSPFLTCQKYLRVFITVPSSTTPSIFIETEMSQSLFLKKKNDSLRQGFFFSKKFIWYCQHGVKKFEHV